ncbi:hypothetical protein EI94DRAFT_1019353 [Lactarius quietus]|nr:hypothetical protein EI94DRAFT_1019353 [Lactarius quietus]
MSAALPHSMRDCCIPAGGGKWICSVCRDSVTHTTSHFKRHLTTVGHKRALEHIAYSCVPGTDLPDDDQPRSPSSHSRRAPSPFLDVPFDTEALSTTSKLSGEAPSNTIDFSANASDDQSPELGSLRSESEHESGNETVEWRRCDTGDITTDDINHHLDSVLPRSTASDEWYPWRSRAALTLDLVMNLPRSTFSLCQIDVMRWLLKANGASQVPTSKTIHAHNAALHEMCGVRSIQYTGAFGNTFFVNSLADLISQEMANPRVRPHLHFYPKDAGRSMSEYWHAKHWHESADPDLVTPLATINGCHFFVFEPCLLTDGSAIIPYRWFVQGKSIVARAWCYVSPMAVM